MTKETKILTGLLAGAAIGVGIALILSSDKDGELKEKLNDWVGNLIDRSKDAISNVSSKAGQYAQSAKESISEVKNS